MNFKKGVKKLVAEANAEVITLTTVEAIDCHVEAELVLVDIRDVREIEREGTVTGAFHAPRRLLEF